MAEYSTMRIFEVVQRHFWVGSVAAFLSCYLIYFRAYIQPMPDGFRVFIDARSMSGPFLELTFGVAMAGFFSRLMQVFFRYANWVTTTIMRSFRILRWASILSGRLGRWQRRNGAIIQILIFSSFFSFYLFDGRLGVFFLLVCIVGGFFFLFLVFVISFRTNIHRLGFVELFLNPVYGKVPVGVGKERRYKFILLALLLYLTSISFVAGAMKARQVLETPVEVELDGEVKLAVPYLVTSSAIILLHGDKHSKFNHHNKFEYIPFSKLRYLAQDGNG